MEAAAVFRKTTQERAERMQAVRRERQAKAWAVARQAAALLKTHYHAARVVAFGSLTQSSRFHPWSDVDLAVWGLSPADYFEAVARVLDVGADIKVDLIRAERCKPFLRSAIESGTEL